MSSPSRSPSEHYSEAERLAAAAESSDEEVSAAAVLLALVHAVLAQTPRKALRGRHQHPRYTAPAGNSPRERWLRGDGVGGGEQ
jgi:hypothetical protein